MSRDNKVCGQSTPFSLYTSGDSTPEDDDEDMVVLDDDDMLMVRSPIDNKSQTYPSGQQPTMSEESHRHLEEILNSLGSKHPLQSPLEPCLPVNRCSQKQSSKRVPPVKDGLGRSLVNVVDIPPQMTVGSQPSATPEILDDSLLKLALLQQVIDGPCHQLNCLLHIIF